MEQDKTLRLTPLGQQVAQSVYSRHAVLNEALLAMGVTPETARRDACEIEHVISEETFDRVRAFLSHRDGTGEIMESADGSDENNAENRGNVLRDV